MTGAATLRYVDAVRGRRRLLAIEGSGDAARLAGLLLVGEAPLAGWLRTLWQEQRAVAPFRRALLAPGATAPTGIAAPSRQVCNCFDVSDAAIRAALARADGAPAERLRALQAELQCGTGCGSCLPELRRIEQSVRFAAIAPSAAATEVAA